MIRIILLILFFTFFSKSVELNLICTNTVKKNHTIDVKDMFVNINSDTKRVELGGLDFYAKEMKLSETNISWIAENVELYPDSNGIVTGIIGRFSGTLVVEFFRYEDNSRNSLNFKCKKFKFKDRIF